MSAWDEHVTAALLGTERRDPPVLDGEPGGDDAAARCSTRPHC
ncbi:hypothetical protein [Actinomadura sp. CNU-125]|nr:hypothetical protein [Actinomadura sp. CNU-125]